MKYKLIEKSTGNIVTYADEKLQFGGPWGACDATGNPLYEWQEHVDTATEIVERENAPLYAQIRELEDRQHRSVREYLCSMPGCPDFLKDYDGQIAALRAQLRK